MITCEKFRMLYFASSIIENIVELFSRFRVKLICSISFGPASSACYLLKSITNIL